MTSPDTDHQFIDMPDGSAVVRPIVFSSPFLTVEQDIPTEFYIARVKDAVAILIYVRAWDKVVFISQDRPGAVCAANPTGRLTEVPAGRLDYEATVCEIAANEAYEEAGIRLDPNYIELINNGEPMTVSAGALTERIYFAYAEIGPEHVEEGEFFGNEEEGEYIQRRFIAAQTLPYCVFDTASAFALVQWFLANKYEAPAYQRR